MQRFAPTFAVLLLACATLQAQGSGDDLRAPLPIRDQFLLSNGFFFFEPERARVLGEDESVVMISAADSNTFAKSAWITHRAFGETTRMSPASELAGPQAQVGAPLYLVDGETQRAELSMRHGFGGNFELGLTIPISRTTGGWSDGLIEGVHHALSVGNASRDAFPRNSEIIVLPNGPTQYVRDRSGSSALGDVAISGKYELSLFEERHISLSVSGALELPTGNASTLNGSGSLDGGMQILVSRDFGQTTIHATLGMLRLGTNHQLGTRAQTLITDTVGISRLLTEKTSAVVQVTVSESPFRNIGIAEFTRRSYQLSAGMQHRIGHSVIAYAALIENVLTYENSADAGVAWGIARRF
ncbi:MAG: DUF3187 family protein [Acidobacteriota bacterium]|nr:DUF3187 family protein [Acidobacteriota bacterium]